MCSCGSQRLLSLRDASEFLNLSIPTIHNLISDGKLRVVRSGPRSKIFVDIRELESYVVRNTQAGAREEVK